MHEIQASTGRIVVLGRRDENLARCVTFDISEWQQLYGEGTVQLLAQRCQDTTPYPVAVIVADGIVRWVVKEADVAVPGEGMAELQYHVGDTVVKSAIYRTLTMPALGAAGLVPPDPEKSWVETVLQAGANAENSAAAAEKSAQAAANIAVKMPVIGEDGNWYVWDAAQGKYVDTGHHSGGTSDRIDATDYGAVGDGITDDAPALNALIESLYASGGGTIYLPAGTYMLDSQLTWKSNVSLIGDGVGLTVIKPRKTDPDAENFPAIGFSYDDEWSPSNPMLNCNFRDFTIDGEEVVVGTYNPKPKGIFILYMQNCTFENLRIKNTGATGLGIDFLRNVTINKVHCYNCGRAYTPTPDEAVVGGAGIGIATMRMPIESCVITDCIADSCGNYGIFLESAGTNAVHRDETGAMDTKASFTIANCQCINGYNYGIAVKGTHNVVVANNICRNNARDGFALLPRENLYCDNVSFIGNQSLNNVGCGLRINDGNANNIHKNIVVSDNLIHGNGQWGFTMYDTTVKNMNVSGNTISNNGKEGVYLRDTAGSCRDILVQGNHINNNTADGVLCSYSLTDAAFVGNHVQNNGNRGIAIADVAFTNTHFVGNVVSGNTTKDWMVKGKFNKVKSGEQAVQAIYPMEVEWIPGLLNDSGEVADSESSFVTEGYFYCGGSNYAGFMLDAAAAGEGNRIVGCSFYDANKEHLSRQYNTVAAAGICKFDVPANAKYVRFRMGYTTSITSKTAVLTEGHLLISATDRT